MALTFNNLRPDTAEGLRRAAEGCGACRHPSASSGANALLSPVYWRLVIVIHHAAACLCAAYWMGSTKGLTAEEYVQISMLKVGLGADSLFCTLLFVWHWIVKVPEGAAASRHQWPAIPRISISHSGDTNTSFRSQQITFEKLTACYHSGWWQDFIFCSFL